MTLPISPPNASRSPLLSRLLSPLFPGTRRVAEGLPRPSLRPTAAGFFWLLAVVALIATAINYGNNLVFALAFLLLAVWLQSAWQSRQLVHQLDWRPNVPGAVFAGEALAIDGRLHNGKPAASVALQAARQPGAESRFDASGEAQPGLLLPTAQRGEIIVADLALVSVWPLGLWRARRPVPASKAIVYPRPAGELPLPTGNPQPAHRQAATDDFQGLRGYAPGDSPRRINWRVFSRRDELAVNCFDGDAGGEALWLSWEQTVGDGETRIGQLAAWVLAAEHAGREYGLRLPGHALPPARSRNHRDRCLQCLALFDSATATPQP